MAATILMSWIGATDLRAINEANKVGRGPIGQAITDEDYTAVILVTDYPLKEASQFRQWLQLQTSAEILLHPAKLSSPTDFEEIYESAVGALYYAEERFDKTARLTFHLSPGTPAMAAVWIILGKTRYPARLIESSISHGVKNVTIPFDLAADYQPKKSFFSDRSINNLAFGLPPDASEFEGIIHQCENMRRVVLRARLAASRSIPVLIEGESGTGKELLARSIHQASRRRNKPFTVINCGAIPSELVESELFGHEKGAFTGAQSLKIGIFETADQGTLFLDEVGELPKNMQVKLLRVLQEGEFKRIGATITKKADVRIIAATNRNLIDDVAEGVFREDLFYRLAVAVLKLPPLRERRGDVGLLVDLLLEQVNRSAIDETGGIHKKLSAAGKNLLLNHTWPGNIRELVNTLTRAVVWTADDVISVHDVQDALLPIPGVGASRSIFTKQPVHNAINLPKILNNIASYYLQQGLAETHGNKSKAAQLLGLPSYQTLNNWMKKYDVT